MPVARISYFCDILTFIYQIWLYVSISNQNGHIEKTNPGPKPNF